MTDTIRLGDIHIAVTRKAVKNVHLSVHPPGGHVTLVAPTGTRLEVARAYAISRIGWIRKQQEKFSSQPRESRREYVDRESHYLWGRRYLLSVEYRDVKPAVKLAHKRITLTVRPGSSREKREQVMQEWHRSLLYEAIPPLIAKWEKRLGVTVRSFFLQRMRTKWGGCNQKSGNIRLNTELAKKPKDLLEYVVVHEMTHLIEPTHNDRFVDVMNRHYPTWREARQTLNELPLG